MTCRRGTGATVLPVAGLAILLLLPAAADAQTRFLAVGDSITFGVGDDSDQRGYPPRLESLLGERGVAAEVVNLGIPGETSAEALSRIDEVLAEGGDVLLLMEGTNDVGARVSPETVRFNLAEIASRAAEQGVETVHLTVVPRLPSAAFDGRNRVTGALAGEIRDLAWENGRGLADPFEVFFFQTPNVFDERYVGGDDKLHPNAAGYDLLAQVVVDALTDTDNVPPVTGEVFPENDAQDVDPEVQVRVDLFDFGAGIDVDATELLINGEDPGAEVSGDPRKLLLRYKPATPFRGVIFLGVRSRDLAEPPNELDRELGQFVIRGSTFLDGDIDRDGRVDGSDLVVFAVRFGSERGQSNFRAFADLNKDDVVDGEDLAILASNFGRSSF